MYTRILSTFAALTLSVAADVPSLINYQGRLVDGVGNPIVGKKEFKLDIYDSQTEGTLIYQETLAEITLDEDGAYSFQFGAGESRSETSVLVATGDGEAAFFQKVFEQTPVGVISVTDGTNTFKTGDVPTGDEPFSFTYTASLKRLNLVCNEPPAEGVKFTATFRYAESGIMGALGSAAEHWMEVTIGGDKQEPRQRLVAVPFALRAATSDNVKKVKVTRKLFSGGLLNGWQLDVLPTTGSGFVVPDDAKEITELRGRVEHRHIYPQAKQWSRWIIYRVPSDHFQESLFHGERIELDSIEEVWKAEKLLESDLIIEEGDEVEFSGPDRPNLNDANYVISVTPKNPIVVENGYQYVVQFSGINASDGRMTSFMMIYEGLE
jgi:hypothetical protein